MAHAGFYRSERRTRRRRRREENVATASGRKGQLPQVKRLQSSDRALLEKNQKCFLSLFSFAYMVRQRNDAVTYREF